MKTTMTLGEIRACGPCADGWKKLVAACGTSADDHVVDLRDILRSNGPKDAWWATRCLPPRERVALALRAARTVERLSPAAKKCNDVTERWLAVEASDEELAAASDAAARAARAAWAAWAELAAAARAARAAAAAAEAWAELAAARAALADAAAAEEEDAFAEAATWTRLGDIMQQWCDEQDEVTP